jgi:hypothetical protein
MYHAGLILYFPNFYFKNGAATKAKYFLVLKEVGADLLLVSLPSSVDHLPRFIDQPHGCIEIPEGSICCYIFKAGQVITESQWAFAKDTYLYGEQLDEYEVSMLEDIYPLENIDYEIVGTLTAKELAAIIYCFANSATVKRKYKRLLTGN